MATFNLEIGGGVKSTGPAPADFYYRPEGSNGYADVAAACAAVPEGVRIGRTVLVAGVEYAWGTDTSNAGLTVKAGGSGGTNLPANIQAALNAALNPDAGNPFATLADVSLTPEQQVKIDALTAPVNLNGLQEYDTWEEALAAQQEDDILGAPEQYYQLVQSASVAQGAVIRTPAILEVQAGRVLTFPQEATVEGLWLQSTSSAPVAEIQGLVSWFRGRITCPITLSPTGTLRAEYMDVRFATFSGSGTLVLRPGTLMDAAAITAAQNAGVSVIDERGSGAGGGDPALPGRVATLENEVDNLADVARSGSYDDLTNTPTLLTLNYLPNTPTAADVELRTGAYYYGDYEGMYQYIGPDRRLDYYINPARTDLWRASILAPLAPRDWKPTTEYPISSLAQLNGVPAFAANYHTSSASLQPDLNAGRWALLRPVDQGIVNTAALTQLTLSAFNYEQIRVQLGSGSTVVTFTTAAASSFYPFGHAFRLIFLNFDPARVQFSARLTGVPDLAGLSGRVELTFRVGADNVWAFEELHTNTPGSGSSGTTSVVPLSFTAQSSGAQSFALPAGVVYVNDVTVRDAGGQTTRALTSDLYSVSGSTLLVTADASLDNGDLLTASGYGGSVQAAPGGGGSGIDFANPTTLTQAATLEGNKAYYVTGSGYTLTLPNAAQNIGKAIFVGIAAAATGLYPVGSVLTMWAGETVNLRATADGWQETGGKPLAMSITLETTLSQQDSIPTDVVWQVPLSAETQRSGPAGLRSGSTIVTQRGGKGLLNASVALSSQVNTPCFVVIRRTRGGVTKNVMQSGVIRFPSKPDGTNYPSSDVAQANYTLPTVVQTGDVFDLALYSEGGYRLRGQNPGSECVLTYIETV